VDEILVGIGRAPNIEGLDLEAVDVGLYEREAEEKGIPLDSYTQSLEHVDRAILDGEEQGFVKVVTQKGTPRILGATVVARNAGEMISEITLVMKSKSGLSDLAYTIHPYPTQAEGISKIGFAYLKTRLTPTV
jgi:pyruvate/2-oxoglutarate dehydrogenase complex dihydrolipoamide dehydrogenase (E3) component